MKIGNLELKHPILQSPMAGCTDLPFRLVARRFGCELSFCEMAKDHPVVSRSPQTLRLLDTSDEDKPVGMQLVGRDPRLMAEAARILEDLGADLIDVNLGCPVRRIIRHGIGSALLKEPEQVARVVEAMVGAVSVPVTIKMRTGFEDEPDGAYLEVARLAEKAGAAAMTLHGRTRLQKFSGVSNHECIRRLKETVSVPVVGNGNIRSGKDAKTMMDETGCDGVMVARGGLGNPWIYRRIVTYLQTGEEPPDPTPRERAEVLRGQFRLMEAYYGGRVFKHIKRVLHWFIKGTPGAAELRLRVNTIGTHAEFEEIMAAYEETAATPDPFSLSSSGRG